MVPYWFGKYALFGHFNCIHRYTGWQALLLSRDDKDITKIQHRWVGGSFVTLSLKFGIGHLQGHFDCTHVLQAKTNNASLKSLQIASGGSAITCMLLDLSYGGKF